MTTRRSSWGKSLMWGMCLLGEVHVLCKGLLPAHHRHTQLVLGPGCRRLLMEELRASIVNSVTELAEGGGGGGEGGVQGQGQGGGAASAKLLVQAVRRIDNAQVREPGGMMLGDRCACLQHLLHLSYTVLSLRLHPIASLAGCHLLSGGCQCERSWVTWQQRALPAAGRGLSGGPAPPDTRTPPLAQ
jgi:hypothetical protein